MEFLPPSREKSRKKRRCMEIVDFFENLCIICLQSYFFKPSRSRRLTSWNQLDSRLVPATALGHPDWSRRRVSKEILRFVISRWHHKRSAQKLLYSHWQHCAEVAAVTGISAMSSMMRIDSAARSTRRRIASLNWISNPTLGLWQNKKS